jgi:hypothetical protein
MARLLWQPARPGEPALRRRLAPLPWRQLRAPCLVTFFGGIVFYALIVQLSFVLAGVGVTSPAVIGGISAVMSFRGSGGGRRDGVRRAAGQRAARPHPQLRGSGLAA